MSKPLLEPGCFYAQRLRACPPEPTLESANEAGDLHHGWEVEKADVQLGGKLANQRDHPLTKAAENTSEIATRTALGDLGGSADRRPCGASRSPRRSESLALVAKGPSQ